ncbi:MAG TPA: extracellular solute-binding protein [Deinococcales bacterium]|nr:extracellular solute-binding protein [Deinococcales bacterium]
MRKVSLLVGVLAAGLAAGAANAEKVTLTYWQYQYDSKVAEINTLITAFEKANPDITVKQENFPYDSYIAKATSAVAAGQGPDVVNLYYGWLPQFTSGGYLQPLPTADFPPKQLESDIGPLMKASKFQGKYWAVPTAVRTLAVFYNKDLFKAAGITRTPRTWDELVADGKKIQKSSGGRVQVAGIALQPNGQDHNLFREVLVRQWGGKPYTTDFKTITYDSQAGLDAFKFYTGLVNAGAGAPGDDLFPGSGNPYRDAFIAGRAGMIFDGSFAIATIRAGAKFNWGTFELPTRTPGGLRSNMASYWVNGITRNATGAKLDAAVKFLKFLTSESTQRDWLKNVGEIPASTKLAADPSIRKDPVYGPFVAALPYAHATFFADEAAQRKAVVDAMNSVWLTNTDPAKALAAAAAGEQKALDAFFKSNK